MNGDVVISAENLGKKYIIGHETKRENYTTLRDVLIRSGRNLWRKTAEMARGRAIVAGDEIEEFWALRNLSFEIKRGEVIGIIGRNGAGKSTLLKVLSRITEPSEGRAIIRGRVASLLEVGTGFHPELTGRENIYLNGAILGMTRAEIRRQFAEIVAFAEVEKFLDTPVKRYSSGMYVRLAFAVAAHLEPDILIVDEVLAVGDAEFQRRCIGRMQNVARAGRTIMFVSHNMASIQNLCSKSILLRDGKIVSSGTTTDVVGKYLQSDMQVKSSDLINRTDRRGSGALRFESMELRNERGESVARLRSGDPATIAIRYTSNLGSNLRRVEVAIGIQNGADETLCHFSTNVTGDDFVEIPKSGYLLCKLQKVPLRAGDYNINIFCRVSGDIADWIQKAARISIEDGDFFGTGKLPPNTHGMFLVEHGWSTEAASG